jgi:serine/threonine protein kinase
VDGLTQRYCAPEVAMQGARNTKSDIWSLGVVFLEMLVVLKGKTLEDMKDFLSSHGSEQPYVHVNHAASLEFIAELERVEALSDNTALSWTRKMLQVEPQLRPTASALVASILGSGQEGERSRFCGICCFESEDYSD